MSKDRGKRVVELLKELEAGFLPYDIFVQIARLTVLSIIEFVPLRMNEHNQTEVLLLERSPDDPIWPGELHTPGTVVRPTDTEGNIYRAFERILKDELQDTETSGPQYVGTTLHQSKRGMEQAQIYWIEVKGVPKVGTFYGISNLPTRFMESQRKFIDQAASSFIKNKKQR